MDLSIKNIARRITVLALACVMLINSAGCSAFLEGLAISKIENMVNEAFTGFFDSKGKNDLSDYCKKKTDLSAYTKEQKALFGSSLSKTTYEIVETTVKENRTSGTCTVEFKKAPDMSKWDLWIATADEYSSAISSVKRKTVKISFKVVKNDDGEWQMDLDKAKAFYKNLANVLPEKAIELLNKHEWSIPKVLEEIEK